jgi:hypothetical protein
MTTAIANSTNDRVTAELAVLEQLDLAELKAKWQSVYKTTPPPKMSRALSVRAIAYRLQEITFRGIKPATRRLLRQVAGLPAERRFSERLTRPRLKAGAVLLRE